MYSKYGNDLSIFIIHFMYICSLLHRRKGSTGAGRKGEDDMIISYILYMKERADGSQYEGKDSEKILIYYILKEGAGGSR